MVLILVSVGWIDWRGVTNIYLCEVLAHLSAGYEDPLHSDPDGGLF